jgi:FimV-like protein
MTMDLRQRLARFDRPVGGQVPRPRTGVRPLQALIDSGARWCGKSPTGYLRLERELGRPPDRHRLTVLDPSLPEGELLVLDTETTGLESGTGTLIFVVGLLSWTAERQRLVQFFLPEPAGEKAFLRAVLFEIGRASALMSYNGRGFDLPRLRSRIRLQRLDEGPLDRPHLDLLYPVRRLVRGWLPDARLKTIEQRLLAEHRDGDLPGEFAPEVYRVLQLENRDSGIVDVVRHNAMDVESLPRLAARLGELYSGAGLDELPGVCALSVARTCLDRGDASGAAPGLQQAITCGDPAIRSRARAMLARTLRRRGDYVGAAGQWEAQLADQPGDLPARVELAKLLEHRLGDLDRALALVTEARGLLGLGTMPDPALSGDLVHRHRRLVRRLGRTR